MQEDGDPGDLRMMQAQGPQWLSAEPKQGHHAYLIAQAQEESPHV